MLTELFISDAFAQGTTAAESSPSSFIPLILIFAVFYFIMIRPQSKRMKEHQDLVKNLKIGNKVITNSGILGTIRDIDDKNDHIELEIAKDVNITVLKNVVSSLAPKEEETKKTKKKKK